MSKQFIVTLKWLEKNDACWKQRKLFARVFGESVTITPEIAQHYGHRFDADWLAEYTLKKPQDYWDMLKAAEEAGKELTHIIDVELKQKYITKKNGDDRAHPQWVRYSAAIQIYVKKRDTIRRKVYWAWLLAKPRRQSRLPRVNRTVYVL